MYREWISISMLVLSSLGAVTSIAQVEDEPPPRTRGFDNPHRIPNRYIVTLRDDGPEWVAHPGKRASRAEKQAALSHNKQRVMQLSDELNRRYGGRLLHRYSSALRGFAIELDESAARRLAEDESVLLVEPDEPTVIASVQTNAPWHLDRIDEENTPLNGDYVYYRTGAGVAVEIVDTGVNDDHVEYASRTDGGPNWVSSSDGAWEHDDCNGHGTHVAGIAAGQTYGVAKGPLINVQVVVSCNGNGNTVDLIQGINSVTDDYNIGPYNPTVANLSVSTANPSSNAALRTAITNSINDGVIWVAAAGNFGLDACNYLPAAVPEVITVGASSRTGTLLPGTNFGTCIDLFAPGERVESAWPRASSTTYCQAGGTASDTGHCALDGTSMAAPAVTGAVAMYLESYPFATPGQVSIMLRDSATKNKLNGNLLGSPNRLLNVGVATSNLPPPLPPDPDDPSISGEWLPAILGIVLSD